MITRKTKKPIDYAEALSRCATLCERCEQCTPDLREKMTRWGVNPSDSRKVIEELERLRFVDDERFARAYAHDKVCFSGWGRYKVIRGLIAKRLPRDIVDIAMDGIEEDEYISVLRRIIAAKIRILGNEAPSYEEKMKIIRHAMQRGFEGRQSVNALKYVLEKLKEEREAEEEDQWD